MKVQKMESWLPIFPGFYSTIFEYNGGDIEYTLFNNPSAINEALKQFCIDNVYDYINYADYQQDISKAAVDFIESELKELYPNIVKSVNFQELSSPKEYNFYNDSINVEYEVDFNILLKTFIKHPQAAEYLKQRYTSYDGFSSSYPNNMSDWIESAYKDSSHTISSMLEFLLLVDNDRNDLEMDIYEYCSGEVYNGEYIDYDGLIEAVNNKFTWDDPLTAWDSGQLESFKAIVGGSFSDQLLTGIGLFIQSPESIPETDFRDRFGMLNIVCI